MTDARQIFAMYMDAAKMKAVFQKELPDCRSGVWKLTDCQIQHPRYKTYLNPESWSKSFLAAAYHLRGLNKLTNRSEDKILYVKAYIGERSLNEYEWACEQACNEGRNKPLHIANYGMVAWVFPHDPALPWLTKVLSVEYMRNYFSDFILAQFKPSDGASALHDLAIQIVNYRPEIRCTCRYDLELLPGNIKTLYGKTFADDKGAEIHRRIAFLYSHSINNPESFVLPCPVGYDPSLRTLWLEGLNGNRFADRINVHNADLLMIQLARCLHDFHNSGLDGLDTVSEDGQLAEIQKKAEKLQSAFPSLSKKINAAVVGLAKQRETLPVIPDKVVHGDFHIQQLLLLFDNRVALFDFDELAIANPLSDVANFCADLYNLNFDKTLIAHLISRFFNAYKSMSVAGISDGHFVWHLQVQLLTRAYRAYIQQKAGLERIIEQFLEAAGSACLDKNGDFNYG